jgi:hypothetical protein
VTASIFTFVRRKPVETPTPSKMPWQNQDLAELYRVRDGLLAAGLNVEVDSGISDEGDPWFIYQKAGTDTIVVHIARIDDEIHVINCVTGNSYVGTSFREVSDRMLGEVPLALGRELRRSSNVVVHPRAFLTAFVAAAIMLVDLIEHNRAEATENPSSETSDQGEGHFRSSPLAEANLPGDDQGAAAPSAVTGGATESGGPTARRFQKESAQGLGGSPVSGQAGFGHGAFPDGSTSLALSLSARLFTAELLCIVARDFATTGGDGPLNVGVAQLSQSDDHALSAQPVNEATLGSDGGHGPARVIFSAPHSEAALVSHHVPQARVHHEAAEPGNTAEAPSSPMVDLFQPSSSILGGDVLGPVRAGSDHRSEEPSGHAPIARSAAPASGTESPSTAPSTEGSILDVRELSWVVAQVTRSVESTSSPAKSGKGAVGASPVETVFLDGDKSDMSGRPVDVADPLTDLLPGGNEIWVPAHSGSNVIVDTLVAGAVDIIYCGEHASIVVEGFVLGEDLLAFTREEAGDSAAHYAWQEGGDLVLGGGDIGMIRLVGVLAEPSTIHPPAGAAAIV